MSMPGLAGPVDRTPHNGYANMVWGISPSALVGMLDVAGFDVLEVLRTDAQPFFTHVLAKPRDEEPVFPPFHLNREHAEQARQEGRVATVVPFSS